MMQNHTIFDAFLQNAQSHPHAIAIRAQDTTLTYQDLSLFSHQFSVLIQQLTKNNRQVCILAKRTPALVAAVLSCARAGCAFAILDSAYPAERLQKMIAVLDPSLLIGIDFSQTELNGTAFNQLSMVSYALQSADIHPIKLQQLANANPSVHALQVDTFKDVAYYLFTSGTTGEPKCIQTAHAPLVHFVEWYRKQFSVQKSARFSMFSGLSHDPILRDIFVPLSTGGQICIPPQEILLNPIKLFNWLQHTEITHCHLTPQLLRLICAGRTKSGLLSHLRYVMSGGDALKYAQYADLLNISPKCHLVNFYGTSETPQAMGYYELKPDRDTRDPLPVGYAIDAVEFLILQKDLSIAKKGERGQIGIKTKYLSLGYKSDTSQTAAKYLDHQQTDEKTYLTGDIGYFRGDGALIVEGRDDDQVKIRGFRVELSTVNRSIEQQIPQVNSIVLALKTPQDEQFLVAFIEKETIDLDQSFDTLKAQLHNQLPSYMVPNHFVLVEDWPLMPNGKTDRKKLIAFFELQQIKHPVSLVEFGTREHAILEQWQTILSQPNINPKQSFNDLGGDSLSYIQASIVVEKTIGWLPENWERMPVRQIITLEQKNSLIGQFSMSTLVRAVSIVLVVLGHLYGINIKCTTLVLLLVAGYSLGKYQLKSLTNENQTVSFGSTLLKIALPTILVTSVIQLIKGQLHFPTLLLVSNIVDPTFDYRSNFWFVYLLIQCLVLMMVLFWFKPVKKLFIQNKFNFSISAALIGIAISLLGSFNLNKGYPWNDLPHMRIWLIFIGMAIAYAVSQKQKIVVALIMTVSIMGTWFAGDIFKWFPRVGFLSPWNNGDFIPWFPVAAVLMMVFLPVIKLPFVLSRMIGLLATSSLFIYLTHLQLALALNKLDFFPKGIEVIIASILVGIFLSLGWDYSIKLIFKKWAKTLIF